MRILPDMSVRALDLELMDRQDADLEKLCRTVKQFELINVLFSSSRRLIKKHLFARIVAQPCRSYSFLDIGTGGCDIPRWIVRVARRKGWDVTITAIDADERIVPWAQESTENYPEIKVVLGSTSDLERWGAFDFIFSNHVFHHLPQDEIVTVLKKICTQARIGFLVNDLRRSRWAYAGYSLYAALFARNSLAFFDGRLSIRRGFSHAELEDILVSHLPDCGATVFSAAPARTGFVTPI